MGNDHHSSTRLDFASVGRGVDRRQVPTSAAIEDLGRRLKKIVDEYGPDAVGFFRGNSANKDVAGRTAAATLARQLGTKNLYSALTLDNVSKVAVSSMLTGESFEGLIPIIDWDESRLVLLVGANPIISHGHDWGTPNPVVRLRSVLSRGSLWVVDPRQTETAKLATQHLAIEPGSDYAVLAYAVRELLADGADLAYLEQHAAGLQQLLEAVEPFSLDEAVRISGLDPIQLIDLVNAIRHAGVVSAKSGTGLSMSASPAVAEWLLWALQIVTHSFEQPGGCWFHPDFFTRLDTQAYPSGTAMATPPPPTRAGVQAWRGERPCAAMAGEIEAGNLRALIVYGGNPVVSFPDTKRITAALAKLDVLAVADVQSSPSTELATHVLPAFGSLERPDLNTTTARVAPVIYGQYTPRVVEPAADREALWRIFGQLGSKLGVNPVPGRLDLSSSDDEVLAALLGPAPRVTLQELKAAPSGIRADDQPRGWVEARVLPEGRWQLAPEALVAQLDRLHGRRRREGGLVLLTRRQQRHVNSKIPQWTAKGSPDEPLLTINPADAERLSVSEGQAVLVVSGVGQLITTAHLDTEMLKGTVSVPHGFSGTNVNQLTGRDDEVDPITGMPAFSGVEVDVVPQAETATA